MTLEIFLWFILIFGVPSFFAFILLFCPHKIVQWQGSEYRKWYKGQFNMSDDDIDRIPQLPTDRALMGKRSHFINEAPENPEKFTGLILIYRIFGVVVVGMLLLVLVGVIFFFVSGAAYQ